MKFFTEMKQTALKAVPDADACFDCGGALQFCRSSAERGFGENEVMIDKPDRQRNAVLHGCRSGTSDPGQTGPAEP